MKLLGARDAIILDNGNDVMMGFDGSLVLGSAEGERNRLRSILVFRRDAKVPLRPLDARLVTYPRQVGAPINPASLAR
jgi:hypothetical protein